jgi:hypothetical protein
MKRFFFILPLVFGLSYLGDAMVLRCRMIKNWNPFGTAPVRCYYAIAKKNNRTEFIVDDSIDMECVHAIYPNAGDNPCWYMNYKKDERIDD